jgi:hypothetical protein
MEKIINEFRVIETDDGFRIEIKGDKEKMKDFMHGFGSHRGWNFRGGRRRRHGWGPFGFGMDPMMWVHGAPWWGPWDFDQEDEEEAKED